MDLLALLFPRVRAAVLRLLFRDAGVELHLRELARRSGLSLGTVQGELGKLSGAELVVSERDGNRLYYRANAAHPLFPALLKLVRQAAGPESPPGDPAFANTVAPANARRPPIAAPRRPARAPEPVPPDRHARPAVSPTLTLNEFD